MRWCGAAPYQRLTIAPSGSFFLLGVRGVGKSTWARTAFPNAHVVDLLDERRHHDLSVTPGLLADGIRGVPPRVPIVIDEVQRVPAPLNEVHRAIEGSKRRFILLGSSARKLKTASTNLLAGRAAVRTMFPFLPAELGLDFNLDRALAFGSIPVVWQAPDARASLEAYVQLYVREEIRAEALVRSLPGKLFDEVAYWSPAQTHATEVDFVLRRGRDHLAIEVKHQARYGTELLNGLRAIGDLPRLVRRMLVYRGRQAMKTQDGIDVWPFERFSDALTEGTLWP